MAVCGFDGVDDDITVPSTGIDATGAMTLACLINKLHAGAWSSLITFHDSGGTAQTTLEFRNDDDLMWGNLNDSGDSNISVEADDGWVLVVGNKADGNTQPRVHIYRFDTEAWTHEATDDTAVADGNAAVNFKLGEWATTDNFQGNMAVAGIWESSLSDADIEALATNLATADWVNHAVPPSYVSEPGFRNGGVVEDLVGTNDSSSINGTTIVNDDDPPGWTFGAGGGEPPPAARAKTLATLGVG